ncbi:uncharacterized protein LOC133893551 [Phragmites australis]|uniref:uncharacterized protein LOC133893551 n=1 Tax=Phragmites australis TaxID=29695 RepID=UPI002D770992|nr:uncharacterized protein LOC133893551 [Phragmites australis]
MPFCCVECKTCNGMPALFKCRRPTLQLRRVFGKMKMGGRRRRRAGSFSSVRAVFWPLMSMRSDVDARNDVAIDPPPSASTDDSGARAPSPSLDNDTPGAASTTAARVLALQARLGEAVSPLTKAAAKVDSINVQAARDRASVGGGDRDVDDVEEACRSFEKHLLEMLVEERKVMDLTDVEELLCCWEKLKCPAFVQLVGRFYGELCMDLFSGVSSESEDLAV